MSIKTTAKDLENLKVPSLKYPEKSPESTLTKFFTFLGCFEW
jgi:hypothetical protein